MNILGGLVKSLLPVVPRPIVARVATRYVAGATLEQALSTARGLRAEGATCTMDILGEFVSDPAQAEDYTEQYLELIDALKTAGIESSASVKLTMLGLSIDPALCARLLDRMCARAAEQNVAVTIDMEDSSVTDATLALWRQMRGAYGNVGCVLQAYLRRTLDDARALPSGTHVRLCKGIYVEPEDIAYKGYQEIRDNYVRVLDHLMGAGHYTCIATHDDWLADRAAELIAKHALSRDQYEYQMLLGVRPALRRRLIAAGHRLRVYVPYGRDWYPYSIRRLRENPQVALHVLRALLGGK
jgi:proline dehydrogenase